VAKRSKGKQGKKGRKKKKSCRPEPATATCGGRCGTRTNTCGKRVSCPACPAGRVCLANGSCALDCAAASCSNQGGGFCTCPGSANPEGIRACIRRVAGCDRIPVVCERTEDCPLGQHCQLINCDGGAEPNTKRCMALCTASDTCGDSDACAGDTFACGDAGTCFQPLQPAVGEPNRCGVATVAPSCGCTSDQQCAADHGPGAFCVAITGAQCTCGAGGPTTFCATPR
jgi:hypothetical protein